MPKMRSRSSGATIANSTIDWERWLRTNLVIWRSKLEAADAPGGVDRDGYRVAQHSLHEAGRESEAHDNHHVDVLALEAVVRRSCNHVEAWRAVVTDVEQRRVQT